VPDQDDELLADENGGRAGVPIDPTRIVRIYLRSWRWIVVALAIGAVGGVVYAKTKVQKVFEAETVVGYAGTDYDDREVTSMIESMTLTENLEEVKKKLGLTGGAEGLRTKIKIAFEPRFSNLVYVRTQASTGKGAKAFADTLANVFVEQQAQRDRGRRDEEARKLQMDLEVAQARLSYAREVFDAFRNRYGVMNLSEETNAALQQAIALRSQAEAAEQSLKAAEGAAQDLRSRLAKAGPEVAGPTAADPAAELPPAAEDVPMESQQALDTVRRQLAAAQVRLSPDHPEIKLLEAKVRDLEKRVSGPTNTSGVGLSTRLSQVQRSQADAQGQFRALSSAATEAETRLKQLAQGEGEAAPLMADLGVADNRMRDVKNRLSLALDAARNAVPPFHIVALATEPTVPTESKAKLVALAGPVITLILALIGVLIRGLRGLKVYTPSEVAYWGNGPVIGATTWPRDPSMLASLFRELDDCTPFASGLTLIVGAHDSETSLARGVAMLWPAERYAANAAAGQAAMTVVDPNLQDRSDETPEKVVISQAGTGGGGSSGGGGGGRSSAAIVPLQVSRANLMRAEVDELTQTRDGRGGERREVINIAQSWTGPLIGPELRRASRLADRVLVVVRSGQRSLFELSGMRTRLGRDRGIGYLLVDLDPAYDNVKDRVGNVNDFWRASRDGG
jgi:uncharacterized protein involved in exopolysaccharide biosynthesis